MRLLVTGGTGVLGRHLRHLVDTKRAQGLSQDSVTVLTRSVSQTPVLPHESLVETDYSTAHLRQVAAGHDVVVHLAASRSASADPAEHVDSLLLADRVFGAAAEHGVKTVFASTISVYGVQAAPPWHEDSPADALRPYGVLKHAAEQLGRGRTAGKAEFVALRFGHLYGAAERNSYLVNVFMDLARRGEELHLHQSATSLRDFLYAGAAAQAVLAAAAPGPVGVFNIGSGRPVTNQDIAEAIVEGFGSSSRIVVDDPDGTDTSPHTGMDISRAREALGFVPPATHAECFAEIAGLDSHPVFHRTEES